MSDADREEPAAASTAGDDREAGSGEEEKESPPKDTGDEAVEANGTGNGDASGDLDAFIAGRQLQVKDLRPQRKGVNMVVKVTPCILTAQSQRHIVLDA